MLLPEPLRNGYMHTPSQMVTEHDGDAVGTLLFEGVLHVVDEWQRHLIHIGALVRAARSGPTSDAWQMSNHVDP